MRDIKLAVHYQAREEVKAYELQSCFECEEKVFQPKPLHEIYGCKFLAEFSVYLCNECFLELIRMMGSHYDLENPHG